ncbi:MAG: DNA alkylation repair protein [Blastocatellia bacterium]
MTLQEVMKQLEAWGTAQNRKIYARHGASANMFGVSFANLYKLQKQIKVDHGLAQQLWETGNSDAQVLATLVADPQAMTDRQSEEWVKNLSGYGLTEMFGRFLVKSPLARKKAEKWHKSKSEWIASAGWIIVGGLALYDHELPDEFFEPYLKLIESGIHRQKNRVRYEMNAALIGIGLHSDELEKKALAVAAKIGKVVVDHGETNCKTPDAAEYIKKSQFRHKKMKAKAAAGKA